jgi:hypothetical protein
MNNCDTDLVVKIDGDDVVGIGSFHKSLPHNKYGEVDKDAFENLVRSARGQGVTFDQVQSKSPTSAKLTNPRAGLAHDRLTAHPSHYSMPPAPRVLSDSTAAEMTELYWMALLRDRPFGALNIAGDKKGAKSATVGCAIKELNDVFAHATTEADAGRLATGVDLPGASGALAVVDEQNLFRMGLPGDEFGPLISQFFLRPVGFGTQTISQEQVPYAQGRDYLTEFTSWLHAQNEGKDAAGNDYPKSNDGDDKNFEQGTRYISTMRDLARFVNKDALHQAYFNAALIMLGGEAKWTAGNPYGDVGALRCREAGFGVLGGPHILALVSEVATRALKVVWNQKWQVHLRLRPEAYAGLVHVQNLGAGNASDKRAYGLPDWVANTDAALLVKACHRSLLLPMAFTAGSPTHPAYGAGHATVAGACVTILKAYFQTFTRDMNGKICLTPFTSLTERENPYSPRCPVTTYTTNVKSKDKVGVDTRVPLDIHEAKKLTLEGELNKLAENVAMGRSMGGVHWRSDNTRSLVLGEALAARMLADITVDASEGPVFEFRTFTRRTDGQPKIVTVRQGRVYVDGAVTDTNASAL